jgi:hypothetical protein
MAFEEDKLDAVLTLRTAKRALSSSQSAEIRPEELTSLKVQLGSVRKTLDSLRKHRKVEAAAIGDADSLFRSLCAYAAEARAGLFRASQEASA